MSEGNGAADAHRQRRAELRRPRHQRRGDGQPELQQRHRLERRHARRAALAAALVAGFSVDQDSWDYSASQNLDFLRAGETITFSYNVVATDDSGAGNAASAPHDGDDHDHRHQRPADADDRRHGRGDERRQRGGDAHRQRRAELRRPRQQRRGDGQPDLQQRHRLERRHARRGAGRGAGGRLLGRPGQLGLQHQPEPRLPGAPGKPSPSRSTWWRPTTAGAGNAASTPHDGDDHDHRHQRPADADDRRHGRGDERRQRGGHAHRQRRAELRRPRQQRRGDGQPDAPTTTSPGAAGTLGAALAAALVAGFSVDQDSWDYSSSQNLDFLAAGETITFSFNVVATDDSGAGNAASRRTTVTITITGTNDAPVNSVPGTQSVNEDTPLVFSAGNGNQISISDVDNSNHTVTSDSVPRHGDVRHAGRVVLHDWRRHRRLEHDVQRNGCRRSMRRWPV